MRHSEVGASLVAGLAQSVEVERFTVAELKKPNASLLREDLLLLGLNF